MFALVKTDKILLNHEWFRMNDMHEKQCSRTDKLHSVHTLLSISYIDDMYHPKGTCIDIAIWTKWGGW